MPNPIERSEPNISGNDEHEVQNNLRDQVRADIDKIEPSASYEVEVEARKRDTVAAIAFGADQAARAEHKKEHPDWKETDPKLEKIDFRVDWNTKVEYVDGKGEHTTTTLLKANKIHVGDIISFKTNEDGETMVVVTSPKEKGVAEFQIGTDEFFKHYGIEENMQEAFSKSMTSFDEFMDAYDIAALESKDFFKNMDHEGIFESGERIKVFNQNMQEAISEYQGFFMDSENPDAMKYLEVFALTSMKEIEYLTDSEANALGAVAIASSISLYEMNLDMWLEQFKGNDNVIGRMQRFAKNMSVQHESMGEKVDKESVAKWDAIANRCIEAMTA